MLGRKCDADARIAIQSMAEYVVRLADDFQHARRELLGEMLATTAHLQNRELITTYAADKVAGSQARRQTMCYAP